jgi:hypothetical protein
MSAAQPHRDAKRNPSTHTNFHAHNQKIRTTHHDSLHTLKHFRKNKFCEIQICNPPPSPTPMSAAQPHRDAKRNPSTHTNFHAHNQKIRTTHRPLYHSHSSTNEIQNRRALAHQKHTRHSSHIQYGHFWKMGRVGGVKYASAPSVIPANAVTNTIQTILGIACDR